MAQDIPGVQINLADYLKGKADGTTKVVKLNGKVHYTQKRFNAANGQPEPVFVAIDKENLIKAKADLENQVKTVDALLVDIDAAQELL